MTSLKQPDISDYYHEFRKENKPMDRYSSFDYCYNYFHPNSGNQILGDIEKSCLALGFYLSSWGMLRGSTHLITKSAKCYLPLIQYIANIAKHEEFNWHLDVNDYKSPNERQQIMDLYKGIHKVLNDKVFDDFNENKHSGNKKPKTPTLTLVTKIMLGVFGVVPAYDEYFKIAFKSLRPNKCGFNSFLDEPLDLIYDFYIDNKPEIDKLSDTTQTIDFKSGKFTEFKYTKAKIIDMYGFIKGEKMIKDKKAESEKRKRLATQTS